GGGENLNGAIDLREFQRTPNHSLHSGQAQGATQLLQFNQAAHDGADSRTINEGHPGEVEHNPCAALADHVIQSQLNLLAVRSDSDAASHLQYHNARLDLFLDEFHVD